MNLPLPLARHLPVQGAAIRLLRLLRLAGPARPLLAGSIILGLVMLVALAAGLLYPGDPLDIVARPNAWPGTLAGYPLGTDMLGRDIAAGLAHASRISLLVGVAAALLAVFVGITVGIVAGYFGGWADDVLMRITEIFQTLPSFLLAIVLVVILEPSVASIIFAIGITSWPQIARLARAEAMRVRNAEYVAAAATIGLGHARILARHVLPNSVPLVIVATAMLVAQAILTEASLSFLGLGDPGVISWGSMVGAGRDALRTGWYMTALPGVAIFVTVIGFMLVGSGLNDRLNPRLNSRAAAARPTPLQKGRSR
ncbi:ABC transporter permease [Achromobacter aloeverae]|uniref:ABC transporter permease n=1 Tax=Achromobacter aloeverae TaxID=1750518 RepID=A0A4Q1HMQ5_9BURK|nr:ABC transporter permease [Achromobacter aloeverae]RXN92262.1 ABC transporter permease [Achromobacter aloeverae]